MLQILQVLQMRQNPPKFILETESLIFEVQIRRSCVIHLRQHRNVPEQLMIKPQHV